MSSWRKLVLAGLFMVYPPSPLLGETVRLRSGRVVEIIDGQVPKKAAEEIYHEAEGLMRTGRLDLARDNWQLILDRGQGHIVSQARAAQEKARRIEYGSLVILRNGEVLRGKVRAHLRTDLLGLEGKKEIPIWQVEEIAAEYHPGYSRVTRTFYPLTILEIKLRNRGIQTSRITREIEFTIETKDGLVRKAVLGKAYELLRPGDLGRRIETVTEDRIIRVSVYPDLKSPQ
ncbi:MAG: hypothetical protein ACE5JU_04740 [Candidatus Binatia bacterium]